MGLSVFWYSSLPILSFLSVGPFIISISPPSLATIHTTQKHIYVSLVQFPPPDSTSTFSLILAWLHVLNTYQFPLPPTANKSLQFRSHAQLCSDTICLDTQRGQVISSSLTLWSICYNQNLCSCITCILANVYSVLNYSGFLISIFCFNINMNHSSFPQVKNLNLFHIFFSWESWS